MRTREGSITVSLLWLLTLREDGPAAGPVYSPEVRASAAEEDDDDEEVEKGEAAGSFRVGFAGFEPNIPTG
jgi:hypothetical protein